MDPNNQSNPNNPYYAQGYNAPYAQQPPQPNPVYYVPNQGQFQNPYVQPPPQTQPQPQYVQNIYVVPPQNPQASSSVHTPLVGGSLKDILTAREYQVQTGKWLGEGWNLYKENWFWYSLITLIMLGLCFIPYVGGIIAFPLVYGIYLVGADAVRSGQNSTFDKNQFVHGYFYFFPLLLIGLLHGVLVAIGFFLLIVPGIYFLVTLTFWPTVWLEFRRDGVGIMDSMSISRKQVAKNFCGMFGFLIVLWLVQILGLLCFLVGVLVSIPVCILSMVFAFRDIFGFSSQHQTPTSCICC